jgi:hypothetical protein
MTADAIRTYLKTTRFTPINLITSSGKSYIVRRPDFITFSPGGRTCNVYPKCGDYYTMLDVSTITEVTPVKRRAAGKKKR